MCSRRPHGCRARSRLLHGAHDRFRALYVFLVLAHDRRRILRFERMRILAVLKQTKWVLPNGIRIGRGRRTQSRIAPAAAPCSSHLLNAPSAQIVFLFAQLPSRTKE